MILITRSPDNTRFILDIHGKKKEYKVQELSPAFVSWNLGQRIAALQNMLSAIGSGAHHGHHGKGGGFGAHLPVCITNNLEEDLFPFNAATKGTGFVAKETYMDYYLEKFHTVYHQTEVAEDAPADEKAEAIRKRIHTILAFYEDTEKIDLRCLAGLEIWPGKTSRNFSLDPRVSLHFLGMPSPDKPMRYNQWQVNCIWEKIEPHDKRFEFGVALRTLTLGHVGKSFVPGHIPVEKTPIKGNHPFGWNLWVIETLDKGIEALHS